MKLRTCWPDGLTRGYIHTQVIIINNMNNSVKLNNDIKIQTTLKNKIIHIQTYIQTTQHACRSLIPNGIVRTGDRTSHFL